MDWAEEFGIGEMGLSPDTFWSLTVREFWIKHRAFSRAEDRAKSLVVTLALMTGDFPKAQHAKLERSAHALRRYPIKSWLVPK